MDRREVINGSISIFLILVLVPLYLCVYLVVGSVRYSAGRSRLLGILNLNGNSALNHYDLTLKQQFDLFTMGTPEAEQREKLETQYLEMIVPEHSGTGVWKNVVAVTPESYTVHYPDEAILARPERLEETISAYMEKRAPILFAREFQKKYSGLRQKPKLLPSGTVSQAWNGTPQIRFLSGNNDSSSQELVEQQFGGLKSLSEQRPESLIQLEDQSVTALVGAEKSARIDSYAGGSLVSGKTIGQEDSKALNRQGKKIFQALSGSAGKEAVELEEYVSHMFSCYTTGPEEQTLTGKTMAERKMYRGEWEYLLYGNDRKRANVVMAASEILALRLYLNSLYAYSSPKIQAEALEMAGPLVELTGGAAAGVSEAIIALWVLAESVSDIRELLNGGTVPFYKTDATWRTGISGSISQNAGSASDLSYKDYLRLFLLAKAAGKTSRAAVLARTAKLMQIVCSSENSDFDLTRCYQQIELEAKITAVGHSLQRKEMYSY